jgi:hypothetical protein
MSWSILLGPRFGQQDEAINNVRAEGIDVPQCLTVRLALEPRCEIQRTVSTTQSMMGWCCGWPWVKVGQLEIIDTMRWDCIILGTHVVSWNYHDTHDIPASQRPTHDRRLGVVAVFRTNASVNKLSHIFQSPQRRAVIPCAISFRTVYLVQRFQQVQDPKDQEGESTAHGDCPQTDLASDSLAADDSHPSTDCMSAQCARSDPPVVLTSGHGDGRNL